MNRATAPLTPESRPRIGPGFRLQWEPVQERHVLLYPEGMVQLNTSAGQIMQRCNGASTLAAIVAELEQVFGSTGLEAEVRDFLALAAQHGWLRWDA
ncbi:pyrroloquinoline quinone biosynthesis peptide chaperone PqqD [Verminephrobacter aporrectodeae subsp. tuberculatae]|uniref:Pyrroloquinoline quinone biosynthesis peptide chaperone PqqD n=1 Tax=Verminephrobacter aporrectodeae subsp. tuberculatae TaxID=1110392 RepID=A0ABT3KX08_9BURK|nr:pyrroloquinoline quinone biosynthesis peptide chaperone PqqD [Verminephrobacter aporrectodeae]MCW5322877.1 pyrroloquinoline quinone biosynthesis peptide chaperone PqqD [Verminephrobacter aporrectodeae subsp. tuberculatae]MCW8165574.1 pyrroloquinoline quinone biosynthesis peptide chaperone PqqD [Verminephrobacter aporrectodeae subsp. tuberculatae]MCW8169585.1 pyrroloquinoline quinone biosynthesis peptide chaperone PqqD [Verminephrobacter aporrectodeae subsp. tuberculatae]